MLRSLPVEAKKKRNASSKIKISRKEKGTTSTLHYVVGTSTKYIGTSIKLCQKNCLHLAFLQFNKGHTV